MRFIDLMKQEADNVKDAIRRSSDLLRHLPRGTLTCEIKNGHFYYRKYVDGKFTYLPVSSKEIDQLKGRNVAKLVLKNAEYDLAQLEKIIGEYRQYDPNELIGELSAAYQGVSGSIVESMGFAYTLEYSDYSQKNPKHQEHLVQTTSEGKKRRSKSEVIIDRIYNELGYPVMYERPLVLPDGETINPDYTTWSAFRRVHLYHEHIGNLRDPEIMAMNYWKFQEYIKAGLYPFDRVLFTFDKPDGGIDSEMIKTLIRNFMQ